MANFFSRLFNTQKTTNAYDNPVEPYQTLAQAQGGPEYYKKITDRSNGIGVGYGSDYTSNANPQIAQLHNQYTGYQLPELNSELTATGRRAGSSGFQQIARSQSDEADKENAIMARLMQNNAEASHNDISQGINDVGNYAKNEMDARNNFSNFRMGIMDKRAGMNAQRNANDAAGLQNMVYAGSDAISSLFGGGQGLGQRQPQQLMNYGNTTYSTSQPPPQQQDYYKQLLARGVR